MTNINNNEFVSKFSEFMELTVHLNMRRTHLFAKGAGLSIPQLHCLFRMKKKEACHVKEVGSIFEISTPAASQMLDKLVQMNLVKREESSKDRRIKNHSLTDNGTNLVNSFFSNVKMYNNKLANEFEEIEYAEVLYILEKITTKMKERENNVKTI
ncbi:MAG: winged helix-turn-helix transcriptional regulator [Spirochaetales bacterium]|nr:winged helix-turn-helix transcriptional regulator [Spirochaetales bacterium]